MNLEEILATLDPKTRSRISSGASIKIMKQKVPSIRMNAALKGGIVYGHQTLIYGTKSSGKSSFCLQLIAGAQKEGKICAWIDAEASFDPKWATKLGVDIDKLIVSSASSINDMVNDAVKLMQAGIDILVVDSISTLLPAIYFSDDAKKEDDDRELKPLEKTMQIGAEARGMTNAVKMLRHTNEKTAIILISQMRSSFEGTYVRKIPTGGLAVQYESGTIIRLIGRESKDEALTDGTKIRVGKNVHDHVIGRPVDWLIEKNKFAAPAMVGSYDFYFEGEDVGIAYEAEVFDMCIELGIIDKGGSWYTIGTERLQGRDKVVQYLKEHPDVLEMYEDAIEGVLKNE